MVVAATSLMALSSDLSSSADSPLTARVGA